MSELSQEDGRLFTVPMIVAGLGSTALFAVASFLAKPRGHNLFRWHAGEIMEDLDPIEWARCPLRKRKTMVTKPTINLNRWANC